MIRIDASEGVYQHDGDDARLCAETILILSQVYRALCRESEQYALAMLVKAVQQAIEYQKIPVRMILDAIRDVEEASHVAD